MAVSLQRSPTMPIDTLFSISSSPPFSSYFASSAVTTSTYYLYQRDPQSHDSNPVSTSSCTTTSGLSLRDINSLSNGMFTNSIKPCTLYNSNKFSVRAASKMPKDNQPLRSCLRVKTVPNYEDNETSDSSNQLTSQSDVNNSTCDLKDQMDRLRINEEGSSESATKEKKKVVFADSKGLALTSVKFLEGPSDLPPLLSEDVLRHIIQDAKPEPDHPYNYLADFEQPASNYLQFREQVEHKCISLENVVIKDNITVMGTIKVKNIAFEKAVYVRVSFNNWRTSEDVQAHFVPQSNVSASRYDTFGFEFDIPPNQGGKEFEFCACYEAGGGSFWDNNKGNNYRIVSQERRVMTQQQKEASYYSSLSGHYNWGEFSFWKRGEDEMPYW